MPLVAHRPPVEAVVTQHVEGAASLRSTRAFLVRAPHVRLTQLARLDERLSAHIDALADSRDSAAQACTRALAMPGRGEIFTATVLSIAWRDAERIDTLLAIAETDPTAQAGLLSAFGWSPAPALRGIISSLLGSASPARQEVALAACAMHGVLPGSAHLEAIASPHVPLRHRALRLAAQLGQVNLLSACLDAMPHEACRLQAALSAVLLGDRADAVEVLRRWVPSGTPSPEARNAARGLLLKLVCAEEGQALLRGLSQDPADVRTLIRAIDAAGDPHYVPWLIKQMDDLKLARLAGEAFSTITGLDLALLDLERKPPDGEEFGPNDDAADADVSMDEDDGLPWPDPQRITAWWQAHGSRFASGTRYFMGETPSTAHCLSILRTGFQRQRAAAAQYLCLLNPGTPLFNVAAPAWRQQRLLASMAG